MKFPRFRSAALDACVVGVLTLIVASSGFAQGNGPWKAGDRVLGGCWGSKVPAVVQEVGDGKYKLAYDPPNETCSGWVENVYPAPPGKAAYVPPARVAVAGPWKAGDRVLGGCWGNKVPAVVQEVGDGKYKLAYDPPNETCSGWVENVYPAPPVKAAFVPPTRVPDVPAGRYECYSFNGSGLSARLTFAHVIRGRGYYLDYRNAPGTYAWDEASRTLIFRGGELNGYRAGFEFNSAGRPVTFFRGASGTRVIDCDNMG